MSYQLTFDLSQHAALRREDFFISAANAMAMAQVENWRKWPHGKLALIGAAGTGKTHLAHVWAAEMGAPILSASGLWATDIARAAKGRAVVVEDVDQIAAHADEAALFHLHNMVLENRGRLLMTGRTAPSRWRIDLPDLASRLHGTSVTTLEAPDDALLQAVLVKLFADRQMAVAPQVINYIATRIERSHNAASGIVQALDQRALTEQRAITMPMAAALLDKGGLNDQ